ncbi:MAG: chromosomal replication initiator protein DnaA, partial [Gammaproteobacteria bacterium]|nr:chromosomal replication initiator protein DnaA [Gammaproteobacteria bacterium]
LLLIDDIHLFADKDKCQEEFFHVFNHLIDSDNVQIVLTSDRYPHEIEGLDARLRSRFVMGFTTEVKNPDLETRAAILVQKSKEAAVDLDLDVALYIAENVKSNVREHIGALKRVIFNAEYHGHVHITIQHVQDILKDLFAVHRRMISIKKIQNIVAEHFHIRLSDILGTSRLRTFVRPRHIAMALAHELTDLPLQTIAGHFNRDHSTVMNAIERVRELRTSDLQIEEDYDVITRKLIN